ncbi:MAG: nitroreductase family protein [Methanobacteriaceae archaeon]|nr:nitroreductase family protein [Methanobacteriaceae archaeon]
MDYFETIEKRYSVRGYLDKPVEKEKLEKILKAGQIAPTGVNKQEFKIFVIDSKKNKKQLEKIYGVEWFSQAPIVLCVASKPSKCWTRPWDGKQIYDIDATIVMDHMILAATALGLGTCYVGAFRRNAAIKLLNLDDEYEPILFTPLGYIDAKPRETTRKPLEELVEYI